MQAVSPRQHCLHLKAYMGSCYCSMLLLATCHPLSQLEAVSSRPITTDQMQELHSADKRTRRSELHIVTCALLVLALLISDCFV